MRTLVERGRPWVHAELSLLAVQHRVLQEALNPRVPLFERVRFLGIFSMILDEYFRVKVASLRSVIRRPELANRLGFDPAVLEQRIHERVVRHQEEMGRIWREEVLPELDANGIRIVSERELDPEQRRYIESRFDKPIRRRVRPIFLGGETPMLRNGALYLATDVGAERLALLRIPNHRLDRFLVLPSPSGEHTLIWLDDVVRACIDKVLPGGNPERCWSVKLNRDAALRLDDEFSGDLLEAVQRSLEYRERGLPSRFLYDEAMPKWALDALKQGLELTDEDLVPGDRYHGYSDLEDLPLPEGPEHRYPDHPPLRIRDIGSDVVNLAGRERLIFPPYHSFTPVLDFVESAARDPDVVSIQITLYRTAKDSRVVQALIDAARAGREVEAFVEVAARFDEEANARQAEELEDAGARVRYHYPGLKVHAKLCLVTRREAGELRRYVYLSTGNFNERTAHVYADTGMFTCDPILCADASRVFDLLFGRTPNPEIERFLLSPFTMRKELERMIGVEIEHARRGEPARITLKLNNLEDPEIIDRLYDAAQSGVEVRLIVRNICCLVPGREGVSENIEARSIVGRYLEHTRIYLFHNGGDERMYLSSADWMTRNLSKRIEVAWPVDNPELRKPLYQMLELQWRDRAKGRLIDRAGTNRYAGDDPDGSTDSQARFYEALKL